MIHKIKSSEFARNVLILLSGSLLSQIVPFLTLPILQKYFYSAADFGILAVFISFCELFSNISCLKLEYGIVIQRRLKDAVNLAYGALRISWVITAIGFVVVLLFKSQIAAAFNEPRLENYLFLLPFYILFVALNDVMSYWFNRSKKFGVISASKVSQTTSAEMVKLAAGFAGLNYIGLLLGRVTGFLITGFYYIARFMKYDAKAVKLLNRKESNKMIAKNKKFIFFSTPSVFLGSLINLVYLNLFLHYFGKDMVGLIGVSMVYLSAGFGVISISFSQVFYAKAAETETREELLAIYKRFAKNLFLIALAPLVVVYLIPTKWVVMLLGQEWDQLMDIARVMVIWLSIWFVSSSLSFIYIRLGRQKEMVLFDLLHLVLIVVSFYIALWIKPTFYSALWGFSIGQACFYTFAIYIAIFYIKRFNIK